MGELRRALSFVQGLAEGAVTSVVRDGPLTALRTPHLSLVWDANHLRVDDEAGHDAAALVEAAGRHGVPSMVVVPDETEGARLAPGFRSLGWRVVRHSYMVQRASLPAGGPNRETDIAGVEPARRELILAERWGTRQVADQVLAFERRLGGAAASDRWFAAPAAGGVAACCRLLAGGTVAQVEDVGTALSARRRGLARAVVCAAVAASRDAGHELTFLSCDADGWVGDFYARLGFEHVGLVHNFHRV